MMNLMINYHNHWWYKAITWILIFAIVILISIGSAPPAKAIGILTATMAAAILAVLAGAGIYTVVSGMTSAQIQSWLNDKLIQWDTYRNDGNVFSDLIQNNLITATVKGTLGIGASAASSISDFITWLTADESITDNSSTTVINNPGSVILPYTPSYYDAAVLSGGGIWRMWQDLYQQNTTYIVWAQNLDQGILYQGPLAISLGRFQRVYYTIGNSPQLNYTLQTYDSETGLYYGAGNWDTPDRLPISQINLPVYTSIRDALDDIHLKLNNGTINDPGYSLSLNSDIVNIPDTTGDKVIGLDVGAFPGTTTEEVIDVILDGVIDNTLDVSMTVTDEIVDAQEVYIINELPISVNTDHHMIGFTNLPDFTHLNLNSIWHYVSDAVDYASDFISWFVSLLTSIPTLAIPLYMSFTLLIVLSFIRRILL